MMNLNFVNMVALLACPAVASHEATTFAVLHFVNNMLTKGRMDPIVSPGRTSDHVHHIMGGSGFSKSVTGKDLAKSLCSNAIIKGDNSNYWFPALYFHDPASGNFEDVEFGYFNAYYFFEKTHDDIKPFPIGLQIVAGDATTRTMPDAGSQPNLDPSKGPVNPAKMTCPRLNNDYTLSSWNAASDGTKAGVGDPINKSEGVGFPDRTCDGEYSPLRADIHFPSCYNPKASLTDFKNNMAYPEDSDGYLDCPKGWVHVPHLFYEACWRTDRFSGRWVEGKGKQPFVFSNGDVTGYNSHADFMAGWDEDLLRHIIATCNTGTAGMDRCPGLTLGLNKGDCTIESEVSEEITGSLSKLPGNNPPSGFWYGNEILSHISADRDGDMAPSTSSSEEGKMSVGAPDSATETNFAATSEIHKKPAAVSGRSIIPGANLPAIESTVTAGDIMITSAHMANDVFAEPEKPHNCEVKTKTHQSTITISVTVTVRKAAGVPNHAEAAAPTCKKEPVHRQAH
ncbi:hypothetical protein FHETE_11186, partial [Fusarium heterosporum]